MQFAKEYRTLAATFISDFKGLVRYHTLRGYLFSALLTPAFMIMTAWVVNNIVAPTGVPDYFLRLTGYSSYLGFVVLGYAFNGFLMAAIMRGGGAVYEEQMAGTLELVFLSPMTRFTWLFGKSMAAMINSVTDLAIIIAFGYAAFRLQFSLATGLAGAFLGAVLTIIALEGFSFVWAGLGLTLKEPHAFAVLLVPTLALISGLMFPVEALPSWVRLVSYGFPLTYGLTIIRNSLLAGAQISALSFEFGALGVCIVVYVVLGYAIFRRMESVAKRKGVLSTF